MIGQDDYGAVVPSFDVLSNSADGTFELDCGSAFVDGFFLGGQPLR